MEKRHVRLLRARRFRWTSASIHGANGSLATNGEPRKTSGLAAPEQSLRSTHSGRTALVKQRLVRMLIVVVIIFFCCWTPSYIWWLLLNAQDAFGVSFIGVIIILALASFFKIFILK